MPKSHCALTEQHTKNAFLLSGDEGDPFWNYCSWISIYTNELWSCIEAIFVLNKREFMKYICSLLDLSTKYLKTEASFLLYPWNLDYDYIFRVNTYSTCETSDKFYKRLPRGPPLIYMMIPNFQLCNELYSSLKNNLLGDFLTNKTIDMYILYEYCKIKKYSAKKHDTNNFLIF